MIRYVLENPVRAGLVASSEHYPYTGAGDVPGREMMDRLDAAGIRVWRRQAIDVGLLACGSGGEA